MLALLVLAALVGQPVPSGGDVPGWVWAALSALAGVATTVLSGKIVVPTFSYNRERDRADRLEAEMREMVKEFVPALVRNTEVVNRQSEALERARRARDAQGE